ncbi:unnamed protein product [Closterium sp. NIES-53]
MWGWLLRARDGCCGNHPRMQQITMQLDLTPSVWEEGEEAAAESGDGEKVQEASAGGGDDVETSGSTKEAAGSEGGEQQLGKAKKQPETKVSEQMEQITMQLDQTPSVWEEGEEAATVEAPAGGGDDVETTGSTKEAAGSEGGEQQLGKANVPALPSRRKPKGADVAEQQLGNEEALLILPHGYNPDEEDEPAYCFLAPAPEEPASMEEALAGQDREKWLVSRDAEYQSLLENGTWDLVVLPEGKKAVQCKWVLRIKTDDKGQVTIYKSRLVAKGFMQKEKQDFNEIFAPTAKPATLRQHEGDPESATAADENFKCKTLGEVKYYLGMHVERDMDHRSLKLHQEKFIKELGEKYGIENERKVATPLPAEFKLVKAAEDEGVEAEEQQQFQSLVGSLLYAAVHTRPDISFSVGQLARVVQNPSEEQVDAAERVVKYLNSHPSIGVQSSASAQVKQKGVEVLKEKGERLGEGKLFLTCFTDATWAYEKVDYSSMGGYICVVGGGPVSWRSKKQTETALSSVESEYMAMFHGVKEVIWLRMLLEEIGQEQKVATPLFSDSKGALGMARNAVLHGLNKHICIKWQWLRKEVKRGTVNPTYIKTHQQPADFLTKRLADEPHWRCQVRSGQVAALSCDCRSLTHPPVLWHHRIGHPSFLRLSRMTLHLDVWGPSPVLGPRHECYFLIVVDDYSRYTTVLPLQQKADVPTILEPRLLARGGAQGLCGLRLHSDRGGEFSSTRLETLFQGWGIIQSYKLPDSPQQNGVAERRIGLVMEVARTSMCHAGAPHFLWPQAVHYAVHQLNMWPSDSRPQVTPVSLWTGSLGVAVDYRI